MFLLKYLLLLFLLLLFFCLLKVYTLENIFAEEIEKFPCCQTGSGSELCIALWFVLLFLFQTAEAAACLPAQRRKKEARGLWVSF